MNIKQTREMVKKLLWEFRWKPNPSTEETLADLAALGVCISELNEYYTLQYVHPLTDSPEPAPAVPQMICPTRTCPRGCYHEKRHDFSGLADLGCERTCPNATGPCILAGLTEVKNGTA